MTEAASAWQFAGWHGGGAYPALVADEQISGRLYLTSDVAGLWRSEDRGGKWNFRTAGVENLNTSTLAIAPSDNNILYTGTKAGIHKSTDAGTTWQILTASSAIKFKRPENYRSIVVDKQDSGQVFAGDQAGVVFYSSNGGAAWTNLGAQFSGPVYAMVLLADNDTLLVSGSSGIKKYSRSSSAWTTVLSGVSVSDMTASGPGETVYASAGNRIAMTSDKGASWSYTANVPAGSVYRIAARSDAAGSVKILAGTQQNWTGYCYLSANGGSSWTDVKKNLTHDTVGNPSRTWSKGFQKPLSVVIDPFNTNVFYYADWWGVWRSDDGGNSWTERIRGAANTVGSDVSIGPDGSVLVASMDNGLMKSTDGGVSYQALMPAAAYSAAQYTGHFWKVLATGTNGNHVVVTNSPWDVNVNQVGVSEDGGATFTLAQAGLPLVRPVQNVVWDKGYIRALAVDPTNPNKFYVGIDGDDGGGLYVSTNGGYNWAQTSGQPASRRIYNGLAIDPTNPQRIYWGATGNGGGVYKSEDGGASWNKVFSGSSYVFDIAVAKNGWVFAAGDTAGPTIYVSKDGGNSWSQVKKFPGGGTAEGIAVDPNNANRIAVGTLRWDDYAKCTIWYSADGGATWTDVTGDLPNGAGAAAMAFSKDGFLYAARQAGSVWRVDVDGTTPPVPPPDTQAPTTPGNVSATASGNTVDVIWTSSTDNVGVTGYTVYRDGVSAGNTSTTQFGESNVAVGTYSYTVKAFDAAGNISVASNASSVTIQPPPDTQAPSAPSSLTASVSGSTVNLAWTASTDNVAVTSYKIYRDNLSAGTATSESFSDSNVAEGTHTYTVKALDAAGNISAASNTATATILPPADTQAPSAPTSLLAGLGTARVVIWWNPSTDNVAVTGYKVYRDGAQIGTSTIAKYYDTNAPIGSHQWQVKAYDAADNLSAGSNITSLIVTASATTVADTQAPTAPSSLTASVSGTTVNLAWTASTDNVAVTGYQVYRDNSLAATVTGTTFSDTGVSTGAHSYFVKAIDAAANVSAESNKASATIADTQAPSAPSSLTAAVNGTTVDLAWTASTDNVGVANYAIYRDDASIGTSVTASFSNTLVPVGDHTYFVKALDAAGNTSASSNTVSATIADTQAPSAPTGFYAGLGTGKVALWWDASNDNVGVTGYRVYRDGTLIGSPTALVLDDTSATVGLRKYDVKAIDAAGNLSAAATTSLNVTVSATTSVQILSHGVTGKSTTTATIGWTTNIAATGYLKYGITYNNLNLTSATAPSGTAHTTSLSGLRRNTVYYYKVYSGTAVSSLGSLKTNA